MASRVAVIIRHVGHAIHIVVATAAATLLLCKIFAGVLRTTFLVTASRRFIFVVYVGVKRSAVHKMVVVLAPTNIKSRINSVIAPVRIFAVMMAVQPAWLYLSAVISLVVFSSVSHSYRFNCSVSFTAATQV